MKLQIVGERGMLGRAVVAAAEHAGHEVVTDEFLDITRIAPREIVAPVVINCAGLVKQRNVPDSRYHLVNAYGPQRLAEACDVVGARLVHVSTDCVFHGVGPHTEFDIPDATDAYARSKLAGEVTRAPHLTVRTSFVGFGARGLLHDLMTLPVVFASDALLWSGHWVDTVAGVLVMLAERESISGLLHLPGEYQSRFDLVQTLRAHFDLPVRIKRNDSFVADRRLLPSRWHRLGLDMPPSFAEQLKRVEAVPC